MNIIDTAHDRPVTQKKIGTFIINFYPNTPEGKQLLNLDIFLNIYMHAFSSIVYFIGLKCRFVSIDHLEQFYHVYVHVHVPAMIVNGTFD